MSYHPDSIGVGTVSRHRRWYLSSNAIIQNIFQSYPLLRRMAIVLSWLEGKASHEHTLVAVSPASGSVAEGAGVGRELLLTQLFSINSNG